MTKTPNNENDRRPSKKNSMRENKKYPYKKRRKEEEFNPWVRATILLGIIFLSLILFLQFNQKEVIELGNIIIGKEQLNSFLNILDEDQELYLCNIESKDCVMVSKTNHDEK